MLPSRAPRVAIAPWRAKLARIRSRNAAVAGTNGAAEGGSMRASGDGDISADRGLWLTLTLTSTSGLPRARRLVRGLGRPRPACRRCRRGLLQAPPAFAFGAGDL